MHIDTKYENNSLFKAAVKSIFHNDILSQIRSMKHFKFLSACSFGLTEHNTALTHAH